jgi:integrase
MLHTLRPIELNSRNKKDKNLKTSEKVSRMSEVTDIFDGHVRIFKTTNSGDVYQMRMYVQEEKRYIRKSLKTRDKQLALSLAQKEFIFYQAKILNGEKLFSLTANEMRERYLKYVQTLVDEKQISIGRQTNIKTFTKHYLEFVGKNSKIQNIDKKFFQGYRSFRQKKKSDITMTVVVNESITIKQMYKWCVNEGLIQSGYVPDFGKIKVRKNEVRRIGYSIEEYRQLVDVSKRWYSKVSKEHILKDEEIYYRKTIRDFIVLMGNYGFRTGELRLLKWKDVKVHQDETSTITIHYENTKVRESRTITGRRGDVFIRRKTYSKYVENDDYIFSHYRRNDVITKDVLYDYFQKLVKDVKLKYEDFDTEKTLYGIRHFWISLHLLVGKIDVFKISRLSGTSPNQIYKHYDNVKDEQISKQYLSYNLTFDKNNEIILDDDYKE